MRGMPPSRSGQPTPRRRSVYLWLGVGNAALAVASISLGLAGHKWWLVFAALWISVAGAYFYQWRRPAAVHDNTTIQR